MVPEFNDASFYNEPGEIINVQTQYGVHVIEGLSVPSHKTRDFVSILDKAALKDQKNLILVSEADNNLFLAARNVPATSIQRVEDFNAYQVLNASNVIFTQPALTALTEKRG